MNLAALLREQAKEANSFLQATAADVTQEQARWIPEGVANPLGALYAHAITSQDGVINVILQGGSPLFGSTWAGKTGISDPQLLATREWARTVSVDVVVMHEYAKAVANTTDSYLASLAENDVERVIDLTAFGMGQPTLYWVLSRLVIGHLDNMTGEISCLKGLQGAKGYPM